jgi:hypothetical protein
MTNKYLKKHSISTAIKKCKTKLKWDSISLFSKWLSSKNTQQKSWA